VTLSLYLWHRLNALPERVPSGLHEQLHAIILLPSGLMGDSPFVQHSSINRKTRCGFHKRRYGNSSATWRQLDGGAAQIYSAISILTAQQLWAQLQVPIGIVQVRDLHNVLSS